MAELYEDCPNCGGSGKCDVECSKCIAKSPGYDCLRCGDSGLEAGTCQRCKGSGKVPLDSLTEEELKQAED